MSNPVVYSEVLAELKTRLVNTSRCFSISAPANFGKSSLLRELAAGTSPPELIYIDCNLRAEDSAQAFYELVLRSLLGTLDSSTATKLEPLYQQVITQSDFGMSRAFLAALDIVLTRSKVRLVLLLDEFDELLARLPTASLRLLRALKDRYSEQLAYVVATNWPLLACGREEESDIAEFYELFDEADAFRLGGLGHAETNRLGLQIAPKLTPSQLDYLSTSSGGHPVLVRHLARLLAPTNQVQNKESYAYAVQSDRQVRLECQRIWRSLPTDEQLALLQFLEGVYTHAGGPLGSLVERGLVVAFGDERADSRLFSLAFEWFVREQLQNVPPLPTLENSLVISASDGLAYDSRHQTVIWEASTKRLPLTGNVAVLFSYLFARQSVPYCSKDELITAIWGQGLAYSSENLDRLVSDLRQLLGDHERQIIRTIHRRGLQMVGVSEWRG